LPGGLTISFNSGADLVPDIKFNSKEDFMLKRAVFVFLTLFIFTLSFSAWGYEAGLVKDGGNIKGS
jgi:hypothetical protein